MTNQVLAATLAWLLPIAVARAEEGAIEFRRPIVCQQEPRCLTAVSDALEAAKISKKEALRLMLLAYAEFPDPRLCFNIGRLSQQTAEPLQAAKHYRQFLDSGAEQNPEILAKARGFLKQAEQDSQDSATATAEPPPIRPQLASAARPVISPLTPAHTSPAAAAIDKRKPAHPVWRIVVGSLAQVGGLVAVGFGNAALSQNGQCTQSSSANLVPTPVCLQMLDTTGIGAGLLTGGGFLVVGGVLTMLIPSRRTAPAVISGLHPVRPGLVGE